MPFEQFNEEEIENQFKIKIKEILSFIEKFNKYDTLLYFYFEYKMSFGNSEEKNIRWIKGRKILQLQLLYLCIRRRKKNQKKITQEQCEQLNKLLIEIDQLIFSRKKLYKDENLTEQESEYLIHSESFNNCTGKRYDIFEVQHHKDLLESLSEEFEYTYNFKLDELYNGILKLKNNFYFTFEDSFNKLKETLEKKDLDVEDQFIISPYILKKENSKIQQYVQNVFSLELMNLKRYTKWSNEFIKQFILKKEDATFFLNDITIDNWNKLENYCKYKPITEIDKNYYLLLEQQFFDNFDRIAIKKICDKNFDKSEFIRKKYTSNIENVVMKYFNNIFGSERAYLNNVYDYNGKIIENDIMIEYDNNIFIIEVKAGNFTPELARFDIESHKKSLTGLIVKANEQQNCLEECLLKNKEVIFYDSNNKKNRVEKFHIRINGDTQIFKIIVTAESFNDIEARFDKIQILSISNDTIVICLDDLRVYSEYFSKHPCLFIQYLYQRKKAIGNPYIDLCDELYHLGLWLNHNWYNEYITEIIDEIKLDKKLEESIGKVMLVGEDWITEIDEYYNNLWFKKSVLTKPVRKIPLEVDNIINFLENNNIKYKTCFATVLLNLDNKVLHMLSNMIENSRKFYKINNKPKFAFISLKSKDENGIDGICVSTICGLDKIEENKLLLDIYANMKLSNTNKVLGVFVYYDLGENISKINITQLLSRDALANSSQVSFIVDYFKYRRNKKIATKKVGRNELCPCGSGKKFKKCCLNKNT